MSLPLPVRLTLFYALLLSLALWGFGSLVYQQAAQRADDDLHTLLSTRAAAVKLGKDLFFASNLGHPLPLPSVDELGTGGVAIEVFDSNLTILATTINTSTNASVTYVDTRASGELEPLDKQAALQMLARLPHAEQTPGGFYTEVIRKGQPVLVYTMVNTDFGSDHIIQTASSETDMQHMLADLRVTLFTGGLLVLVLALVGGLGLTWGTLAAVRRVTQTARTISASQDFRQRVPFKRSLVRDEIATLAATFNDMLANLEHAYQQQTRFIADASHELRAPITSISCNLDLLARAPDLPCTEREATLRDARAEAARMGRLVNDLLTLARADEIASTREAARPARQGVGAQERPRVDLDSLVLDVFRQYRATSAQNDEDRLPHLTLQHITPAQIYGDTDQIKQALVALLDNALKYTPATGSVTLSLSRTGQLATLAVSDTGPGITPEDFPHIFERFYRADRARSRVQEGSGLGLAIVKSIVREHQGHVKVESTPEQGSTFSLSFPIADQQ